MEAFDSLPEPLREYLNNAPSDWKPLAILARLRFAGVESTLEFLRVADLNREAQRYREDGLEINPRTGKAL